MGGPTQGRDRVLRSPGVPAGGRAGTGAGDGAWGPVIGGWALQRELEFFAEAGIPPLDSLRVDTQASAETVGAGDELGTLEVGKLADMVVLSQDLLTIDPDRTMDTEVEMTILGGTVVYER